MAGKKWSFRVLGETIEVVAIAEAAAGEPTKRLAPIEGAWAIESIPTSVAVNDAMVRAELARALEQVEGSVGRTASMTLEELRIAVAEAIRREKLVAFRTSRPMRVQREITVEPLGPESGVSAQSFFELLLVDCRGNPVKNAKVKLTLESGEVKQQTTDGKGLVRIDPIDGDTVGVVFPELPEQEASA